MKEAWIYNVESQDTSKSMYMLHQYETFKVLNKKKFLVYFPSSTDRPIVRGYDYNGNAYKEKSRKEKQN